MTLGVYGLFRHQAGHHGRPAGIDRPGRLADHGPAGHLPAHCDALRRHDGVSHPLIARRTNAMFQRTPSSPDRPAPSWKFAARASSVIVHRVPPELHRAVPGMAARHHPGRGGLSRLPGDGGLSSGGPRAPDWVVVIHFDNAEALQRWLDSPVRAEWTAKLPAEIAAFRLKMLPHGFGPWFAGLVDGERAAAALENGPDGAPWALPDGHAALSVPVASHAALRPAGGHLDRQRDQRVLPRMVGDAGTQPLARPLAPRERERRKGLSQSSA